jgi:hypothetical protein
VVNLHHAVGIENGHRSLRTISVGSYDIGSEGVGFINVAYTKWTGIDVSSRQQVCDCPDAEVGGYLKVGGRVGYYSRLIIGL